VVKPRVSKTDYSKIAGYYDKVRPMPSGPWLSKIMEYGKIGANSVVLDVGCGTGRFPLGILTAKNCMIYALEPSIEMLKQAVTKDKSRNILWIRGDGQKLPFQDNCFNCVYMTLVIHHIENKETVLREIYRTLRKGGNCVIMTVSHSRIREWPLRDFPEVTEIDLKRFPSVPSIKKTMINTGFKNVHYHIVKHDEGYMPTGEYLEKVKNKYISTLTLLSEETFQRGFKIFEQRVRKKYGTQIRWIMKYDFIVGQK